jgi:hypothetical protein
MCTFLSQVSQRDKSLREEYVWFLISNCIWIKAELRVSQMKRLTRNGRKERDNFVSSREKEGRKKERELSFSQIPIPMPMRVRKSFSCALFPFSIPHSLPVPHPLSEKNFPHSTYVCTTVVVYICMYILPYYIVVRDNWQPYPHGNPLIFNSFPEFIYSRLPSFSEGDGGKLNSLLRHCQLDFES